MRNLQRMQFAKLYRMLISSFHYFAQSTPRDRIRLRIKQVLRMIRMTAFSFFPALCFSALSIAAESETGTTSEQARIPKPTMFVTDHSDRFNDCLL